MRLEDAMGIGDKLKSVKDDLKSKLEAERARAEQALHARKEKDEHPNEKGKFEQAKEAVEAKAGEVKEKVAAQRDRAAEAIDEHKAEHSGQTAGEKVNDAKEATKEKAGDLKDKAEEKAKEIKDQSK
jgi:hypothetical protein